jgi:hypothetical protein
MTESPEPAPQRGTAEAALAAGDLHAAVRAYTDAIRELPGGGEPELRGVLLLGRGLARQAMADPHAMEDAVAALEAWRSGRPAWVAPALAELAAAFDERYPDAADAFWSAAETLAERLDGGLAAALIAGERGRQALERGDTGAAATLLERCERLARAAQADAVTATALLGLARTDLLAGDPQSAARRLGEATARDLDPEQTRAARWLLVDVAHAAAASGEDEEAERLLEAAAAAADDTDLELRERTLLGMAGIARARGDAARALDLAGQVAEILRRRGDETGVAYLVHDMGVLAAETGGAYDATANLNEAFAMARRLRLPALAASSARVLATLASLRGDHLRALGFAEQAAAFPLAGGERAACAATLAAIGVDAERWQRHDVAVPAYAGAADIYRSLGDLSSARRWEQAIQEARQGHAVRTAQRDAVEAALEASRRLGAAGDD